VTAPTVLRNTTPIPAPRTAPVAPASVEAAASRLTAAKERRSSLAIALRDMVKLQDVHGDSSLCPRKCDDDLGSVWIDCRTSKSGPTVPMCPTTGDFQACRIRVRWRIMESHESDREVL
jgi:hypothetical protein